MTRRSLSKRRIYALCMVLAIAAGCAGASTPAEESTAAAPRSPRLELGIRLSDGRWLELGDLRGAPVLLFVFATFDTVSQASLKPLRPFVQQHPEIVVIGVAAQPRAAPLVEAWDYALDPPFLVGADPYGRVENGQSVLGKIETVPTYILYDERGYERNRATGYQGEAELDAFVKPLAPASEPGPQR